MIAVHVIVCRARIAADCYDGQPTSKQFGEPLPMNDDNTFEDGSIVCDACYELACQFTLSGRGLKDELPVAISHARAQIEFLRDVDDPLPRLIKAEADRRMASPGSPWYRSATACAELARREIDRRQYANA